MSRPNWRLAWHLLRREQRSGELTLVTLAVGLAMLAATAVGVLTARVEMSMNMAAARMQGGDLVLRGDQPLPERWRERAAALNVEHADTIAFASMVRADGRFKLVEVKGLGPTFPLVGRYVLNDGSEHDGGPPAGQIWVGARLALALKIAIGDSIDLGQAQFPVAGIVSAEPDAIIDYVAATDRVFVNDSDLSQTGLVQDGTRAGWRLVFTGPAAAIRALSSELNDGLERGQRLEDGNETRPELRLALDRAGRFFRLAAVLASVLAGIAVALAARRHAERHLDAYAVLRCIGAKQSQLMSLTLLQLAGVVVQAGLVALPLAWLLQSAAAYFMAPGLGVALPAAPISAWIGGAMTGIIVLYAFALPPLLRLSSVPTLRVLRRELSAPPLAWWLHGGIGLVAAIGLLAWQASDTTLLLSVLGALLAISVALTVLGALLLTVGSWWARRTGGTLRIALGGMRRRRWGTLGQIVALGLGLAALALLVMLRTQLIDRWQDQLPPDVPNRFVIGLQGDQRADFKAALEELGVVDRGLYPMVRGRFTALNGEPISSGDFQTQRARRLAEREFNLSFAAELRADNRIVAGPAWDLEKIPEDALSVERGLAERLGWEIGDSISFDIGGIELQGTVVNLRELNWESFLPNFFVIGRPEAMRDLSASWITSLHYPKELADQEAGLIEQFPNMTVIDVDALIMQIRRTADQAALAIQAVFLFTVAAGLMVLLAAIRSTTDERLREGAILRALGARSRQLTIARAVEFGLMGAVAGAAAALAASFATGWLGERLFDLPFAVDWTTTAILAVLSASAVAALGLHATRKVVTVSPLLVLRES